MEVCFVQCRSAEPEVPQALISDLAESVLKLVCLVGERPQDVVDLLRVVGSISFTDVAEQRSLC